MSNELKQEARERRTPLPLSARIYVAGYRGLVGSAILRQIQGAGYETLITRTHGELDLTDPVAVGAFFKAERPEYVFLAAAKVGGIHANNIYPAEFIHENLLIEAHVVDAAYRSGVKRLLFLGSSCILPAPGGTAHEGNGVVDWPPRTYQ